MIYPHCTQLYIIVYNVVGTYFVCEQYMSMKSLMVKPCLHWAHFGPRLCMSWSSINRLDDDKGIVHNTYMYMQYTTQLLYMWPHTLKHVYMYIT